MDGGCTNPENTQDASNRAGETVFRQNFQDDDEKCAPDHHRRGIEIAFHQQGLASRQHVANQAAADCRDNAQDDGGEGPSEIQVPDLFGRLDRKQTDAKAINLQHQAVDLFSSK